MSVCTHGRLARSCDQCEALKERQRAEYLETCQALVNIGTGVLIAHLASLVDVLPALHVDHMSCIVKSLDEATALWLDPLKRWTP